jgi:putative glutamine amidotransferase
MNRPLIAITPSYTKEGYVRMNPAYLDAVWAAGGMPVFVAYSEDEKKLCEYASLFDGFLFSGGVDLDPKYYGETVQFDSVEICAARDTFELALFKHVMETGKPVFGICRGIQTINVAMGGSLYQHIGGHSQKEKGNERTQRVAVTPGTLLSDITGNKPYLMVNTFHHQAVKTPAPALVPAAYSEDGICESVYLPGHRFFLGVQWHPELFFSLDPAAAALFNAFVGACR